MHRQNRIASNAPSVAPALLAFDRSTARSDGTDSAVLAIEKLQTLLDLLCQRRASAGGARVIAYHGHSTVTHRLLTALGPP
ncbi:hypothetical protein EYR27_05545 [Xanthomonas oryzae]|nr:hypothetical protein EYR27_05545 [Xanthomonas oryzae]